jgi:Mor family transcriptional regulator
MLTRIIFCTVLHIVRIKERSGYKSHFLIPQLCSYKRIRLYIIIEWKKGSINVSEVARSFNCSRNTVYHVIDYYRRHNDVNYTDIEIDNKHKIIYPRKLLLAINSMF